ncbi:kinase-like domain-containing protein [Phlyctochytrium arcticum]|nr:kinase-like domain-containing protein [Phlyctochytrium arcticum]
MKSSLEPDNSDSSSELTAVQRLLNKYPLNPDFLANYTVTAELGSGGFGHVLSAISTKDNVEVAVKLILKRRIPASAWARDRDLGIMPMEVYLVRRCTHPNVVGFKDFYEDERFAYLVMEMHGTQWDATDNPFREDATLRSSAAAQSTRKPIPPPLLRTQSYPLPTRLTRKSSMDLFECIEQNTHLPERHARHVFRQIADAVSYLHTRGIVHRDLKDENIVIDSNLHVKLIDFGSAAFEPLHKKSQLFDRFQGTIQYAAPEILKGQKYKGRPSDVWAMGILLYTMLEGECPFASSEEAMRGSARAPARRVSGECRQLVDWMLEKIPERRPTAEQVLGHSWMNVQL